MYMYVAVHVLVYYGRWDSYYHNSWGAYPATYVGVSHVRYPVPQAPNGQHGPAPQSVFMSAEEELVTFSHGREPPFSQLEDDPQVSLRCSYRALFRNVVQHVLLRLCTPLLNRVL